MFTIKDNASKLEIMNFPDNESFVKFDYDNKPITIIWNYENDAEIMVLSQIFDIIKDKDPHGRMPKTLYIPYLPHARQDRRSAPNQPYSLKILTDYIQNIIRDTNTYIYVLDVHNPKSISENFQNIQSSNYAKNIHLDKHNTIIVPDIGARDRCYDWHKEKRKKYDKKLPTEFLEYTKTRNPTTGELSKPILKYPSYSVILERTERALVIDDIGTGFGTHIQLAKVVKEINPDIVLDIWVTHSSFTKGVDVVLEYFNLVYTTDSLISGRKYHNHPQIIAFDCCEYLPGVI